MRLTPADVHNVAFKKPSIGKRGYDEDEVDAFLDLVEAELARLIEENNELAQRLAAGHDAVSHGDQAPPAMEPSSFADQPTVVQSAPEPLVSVLKAPVVAPPQPVAATPAAPASSGPADHHMQAARLLGLAQETADRLTGDAAREAEETRATAKAESDKLLNDARHESDRMLTDARNESERVRGEAYAESEKVRGDAKSESEKLLTDAKNQSDSMLGDAASKAEALERDSRIRAEALDREAQGKYSQVMGQLTEQRASLEKKVDDLRTYEREYRSRLKGWITDQLSQLDDAAANGAPSEVVSQGS
jgi:DivIVA domain-containing protein